MKDGERVGRAIVSAEERAADEGLPEANPKREEVRTLIDVLGARLLGRHVVEFSFNYSNLRLLHLGRDLGDAKVDDLHLTREG